MLGFRFQVSGVSAASGRRSDQFDPKKKLPVAEFHTRVNGLQPIENVHDTARDTEYLA